MNILNQISQVITAVARSGKFLIFYQNRFVSTGKQMPNGFHAQLKIWMARFHGVATRYLANYVAWHRHLVERNHNDDPNSFIQLSFNPLSINPHLTVT